MLICASSADRKRVFQRSLCGATAAAALHLFLTGCASFPEQAKIAQFGTAASAVTQAAATAYSVHVKVARDLSDEEATLRYVRLGTVDFPPPLTVKTIDPELWQARIATLSAIQDYADELAKIGTPGAAEKAAASAGQLTSSVAALAKAGGGKLPAGLPDAAAAVVSSGVSVAVNAALAGRMRAVMQRTDADIAAAVDLLTRDGEGLSALATADAVVLTATRKRMLSALAADPRSNRVLLRKTFHSMTDDERASQELLAIYASMPQMLKKFATAHHALATSHDEERAFNDFMAVASELRAALAALKAS